MTGTKRIQFLAGILAIFLLAGLLGCATPEGGRTESRSTSPVIKERKNPGIHSLGGYLFEHSNKR